MYPEPVPLDWRTLKRWLSRTRAVVDRRSPSAPRPLTMRRLLRSLPPRIRRPVFVVGAPRSGTSFLASALAAAPEFGYQYEPPIVKAAARCVHEGLWSRRRARVFYRLVYGWLAARRLAGDLRLLDKTPQNCFVVSVLAETFPDARFVHIVRDGRDCAVSHREKGWLSARREGSGRRESGGYPLGPAPRFWVEPRRRAEFVATSDLHRCIWAWRRHVEAAAAQGRPLGAQRYIEVRYERLVREPGRSCDRLADFLELTEESGARLREALSAAQGASVGRWRREIAPDEIEIVEREAGSLLAQLGYSRERP